MRNSRRVDADHFQFLVNDTSGDDLVTPDRPKGMLVEYETSRSAFALRTGYASAS